MAKILSAYSIQQWLESCPQGYLQGTEYGHAPGACEPERVMSNETLRQRQIRTTVQLLAGERCALAASAGLLSAAPDEASRLFLATQVLDEARHVEIFTRRLLDLGTAPEALETTVRELVSPSLLKFAEVLLEQVDRRDFVAGVVGQNIVLEGMAFTVFEMLHALAAPANPKFAETLAGTIADERRHVGFGENRIGELLRSDPARKPHIERMQQQMTVHMLEAFADVVPEVSAPASAPRASAPRAEFRGVDLASASAAAMQDALSAAVLAEFGTRLGRIGLDFRAPAR